MTASARAGALGLAMIALTASVSCGSGNDAVPTSPPRSPSAAGEQFCRDVHGVMLVALNAAADDETTDARALTLFRSARGAFVRDARLDDARVAAMSDQILRGLDDFIAVVRSHGLARALDVHADAFGGAAFEVDRYCG